MGIETGLRPLVQLRGLHHRHKLSDRLDELILGSFLFRCLFTRPLRINAFERFAYLLAEDADRDDIFLPKTNRPERCITWVIGRVHHFQGVLVPIATDGRDKQNFLIHTRHFGRGRRP